MSSGRYGCFSLASASQLEQPIQVRVQNPTQCQQWGLGHQVCSILTTTSKSQTGQQDRPLQFGGNRSSPV